MPRYFIFGRDFETASLLESSGKQGHVHLSEATAQLLPVGWGQQPRENQLELPPGAKTQSYLFEPGPAHEAAMHVVSKIKAPDMINYDEVLELVNLSPAALKKRFRPPEKPQDVQTILMASDDISAPTSEVSHSTADTRTRIFTLNPRKWFRRHSHTSNQSDMTPPEQQPDWDRATPAFYQATIPSTACWHKDSLVPQIEEYLQAHSPNTASRLSSFAADSRLSSAGSNEEYEVHEPHSSGMQTDPDAVAGSHSKKLRHLCTTPTESEAAEVEVKDASRVNGGSHVHNLSSAASNSGVSGNGQPNIAPSVGEESRVRPCVESASLQHESPDACAVQEVANHMSPSGANADALAREEGDTHVGENPVDGLPARQAHRRYSTGSCKADNACQTPVQICDGDSEHSRDKLSPDGMHKDGNNASGQLAARKASLGLSRSSSNDIDARGVDRSPIVALAGSPHIRSNQFDRQIRRLSAASIRSQSNPSSDHYNVVLQRDIDDRPSENKDDTLASNKSQRSSSRSPENILRSCSRTSECKDDTLASNKSQRSTSRSPELIHRACSRSSENISRACSRSPENKDDETLAAVAISAHLRWREPDTQDRRLSVASNKSQRSNSASLEDKEGTVAAVDTNVLVHNNSPSSLDVSPAALKCTLPDLSSKASAASREGSVQGDQMSFSSEFRILKGEQKSKNDGKTSDEQNGNNQERTLHENNEKSACVENDEKPSEENDISHRDNSPSDKPPRALQRSPKGHIEAHGKTSGVNAEDISLVLRQNSHGLQEDEGSEEGQKDLLEDAKKGARDRPASILRRSSNAKDSATEEVTNMQSPLSASRRLSTITSDLSISRVTQFIARRFSALGPSALSLHGITNDGNGTLKKTKSGQLSDSIKRMQDGSVPDSRGGRRDHNKEIDSQKRMMTLEQITRTRSAVFVGTPTAPENVSLLSLTV
jgi:hypothetical protein